MTQNMEKVWVVCSDDALVRGDQVVGFLTRTVKVSPDPFGDDEMAYAIEVFGASSADRCRDVHPAARACADGDDGDFLTMLYRAAALPNAPVLVRGGVNEYGLVVWRLTGPGGTDLATLSLPASPAVG